ncbi:PREDICTED: cytochrome b-c1 complex subunit 8-like [Cyphomyrmex costatus]|uniref:Cytochrome b-c1 complex subunit 8 n=1 Tax=Cyphomyrmex costatus TaxID=456900 RepID=A0A195CRA4_9HYME|nr:PREDICTED: cytochrome b-c1 complex subunit 8-like [Cyphomyrmex costatus]KYN02639.1 Cytochrome b-c1 complex subunit 8 [Cyphomyrmex costatus]
MGLEFGNLPIRIRRIVYFGLSPLEQRAWAKSITHGVPNSLNRAMRALPPMLPGFLMSVGVVTWATAAHDRYSRKDPKLYENDK